MDSEDDLLESAVSSYKEIGYGMMKALLQLPVNTSLDLLSHVVANYAYLVTSPLNRSKVVEQIIQSCDLAFQIWDSQRPPLSVEPSIEPLAPGTD